MVAVGIKETMDVKHIKFCLVQSLHAANSCFYCCRLSPSKNRANKNGKVLPNLVVIYTGKLSWWAKQEENKCKKFQGHLSIPSAPKGWWQYGTLGVPGTAHHPEILTRQNLLVGVVKNKQTNKQKIQRQLRKKCFKRSSTKGKNIKKQMRKHMKLVNCCTYGYMLANC